MVWTPGRTRVKTRHDLRPATKQTYSWDSVSNTWSVMNVSSPLTTVSRFDETMEDDFPTSKGSAHNCRHTTVSVEQLSPSHSWMEASEPFGYRGLWGAGSTFPSGVPAVWDPLLAVPEQDLYYDALNSIDPLSTVWQGLPFIGELKSAVQMIRRPWSFWKAVQVPKRYRNRPCGEILKRGLFTVNTSSAAWLSYIYGWKPLFQDMDTVSNALGSMRDSYNEYLHGNANFRSLRYPGKTASAQRVDNDSIGVNGIRRTYDSQTTTLLTLLYRILPAAQTGNVLSYASYMTERLGLDAGSLLTAAWELRPYSFVADWFLPVGDYLGKVRSLPCNFEVKDVCTHTKQRSSVVGEHRSFYWDVNRPGVFDIDRGFVPYRRYDCEVYTRMVGHPQGQPTSNGLTSTRAITALSLIAQRLLLPITHN